MTRPCFSLTSRSISLGKTFALGLGLHAFGLLSINGANAHIQLTSPTQRYTDLKMGPCGKGGLDARTQNVTTAKPGATITVKWDETIDHPGHFRIAFDPDGAHFTDPSSFTDTAPRMYVLLDNIADKTGTAPIPYTAQVTLPNMECNNCTLQVLQVMTDKPPYGDGNDIYYQCADFVLAADAPDMAGQAPRNDLGATHDLSVEAPTVVPTGCQTAPGAATGKSAGVGLFLSTILVGLLGLARRRRSIAL